MDLTLTQTRKNGYTLKRLLQEKEGKKFLETPRQRRKNGQKDTKKKKGKKFMETLSQTRKDGYKDNQKKKKKNHGNTKTYK